MVLNVERDWIRSKKKKPICTLHDGLGDNNHVSCHGAGRPSCPKEVDRGHFISKQRTTSHNFMKGSSSSSMTLVMDPKFQDIIRPYRFKKFSTRSRGCFPRFQRLSIANKRPIYNKFHDVTLRKDTTLYIIFPVKLCNLF